MILFDSNFECPNDAKSRDIHEIYFETSFERKKSKFADLELKISDFL